MTDLQVGCTCEGLLTVLNRAHVAVRVDLRIFSISAVLRAAYKLTDVCYVFLDRTDDHVTTYIIGKAVDAPVEEAVGRYANELIDQRLREQLEGQFHPIRTLITAQAFSEGNLLDPERDDADHHQDPRGLGRPR